MLLWIEGVLKKEHTKQVGVRKNKAQSITTLLERTRRRKDKLYEDKIDGSIPLAFYERKFSEYTAEEDGLEDSLIKLNDHSDDYQQLGVLIHELAFRAKEIYLAATVDEKRLLMSQLFSNFIQDGLKIRPEFTLSANYLANWMPRLNEKFELPKNVANKGQMSDFMPADPTMLAWWDRLRTLKWEKFFPHPTVSLQQIRQLLAVASRVHTMG